MIILRLLGLLVLICTLSITLSAQSASDLEGVWLREDKKNYKVEMYACGDHYCGKIVWLKEPNDEQGNPRIDRNNPDPQKRTQPLLGIDVLTGFKFDGNAWKGGKIYSFNRGKYYNAQIKLRDQKLYITVSVLFFSKTYTWIKA